MKLTQSVGLKSNPPLQQIRFELTQRCNLRCQYCYVSHFTKTAGKELTAKEIMETINKGTKQGLETISFTGGEPILRYDLLKDMIKYAKQKNLKTGLLTNATLTTKEKISELKNSGLNWIRIGLDGSDEKTNSICRDPSGFKNVLNTIRLSKEAGLYTIVRSTATKQNRHDFKNIVNLMIKMGVDRYDIQLLYPINNKEIDDLFLLPLKDHVGLASELLKLRRSVADKPITIILYYNWFEFTLPEYQGESVYMSSCGRTFCLIDAFGYIKTCGPNTQLLGNILRDDLLGVWNNSADLLQIRKNERFGICQKCDKFSICLNSCPAATYNLHRDYKHTPPLCPKARNERESIYA